MEPSDWSQLHLHILQLEQEGLVTRTFRRLDPERQQGIVYAILAEAAERGPAALNIKAVAQRAGVSVGSLYTYFSNRDGMLAFAVELCVRFVTGTFETFGPALAELPLREALAVYQAGGVEWSRAQAGLLGFFARAAYHDDPELAERLVRPIAESLLRMVRGMLAGAAARGELRPEVDLETSARVIHALTVAVGDSQLLPYLNIYFQATSTEVPPERLLDGLADLILVGIGAREK